MKIKSIIQEKISSLMLDNISVRNELEETVKSQDKKIDEIFREFITVIDTFERAEQTIKEKNLVREDDKDTQTAIKRLLNAKRKALNVLEKYDVKRIEFENNRSIEELCEVTGTEPDPSRETGDIVSIEKEGYTRNGHLIRPSEVIIVRN